MLLVVVPVVGPWVQVGVRAPATLQQPRPAAALLPPRGTLPGLRVPALALREIRRHPALGVLPGPGGSAMGGMRSNPINPSGPTNPSNPEPGSSEGSGGNNQ